MEYVNPDDFEKILHKIKENVNSIIQCDDIRSMESNFNTKGMYFKSMADSEKDGMIIVGEDKGAIAADISVGDGTIRSFIMKDEKDTDTIENIVGWLSQNYS